MTRFNLYFLDSFLLLLWIFIFVVVGLGTLSAFIPIVKTIFDPEFVLIIFIMGLMFLSGIRLLANQNQSWWIFLLFWASTGVLIWGLVGNGYMLKPNQPYPIISIIPALLFLSLYLFIRYLWNHFRGKRKVRVLVERKVDDKVE